jgi:SAM-dependent methyltransferase
MTWDPAWERVFTEQNWGKYPSEELIRFVARNFYAAPDRSAVHILEIGCGTGANLWFVTREGFSAAGVDGSATAIRQATARLEAEGLRADLRVGDAAALVEQFSEGRFDAVLDVACLTHNSVASVRAIVGQIYRVLKPGGRVFSSMFARGCYGDGFGREIEPGTFTGITEGPIAGKGTVHLFAADEARAVFGAFTGVKIEYSARSLDGQRHVMKNWILEGVKPT